MLRCVRCAVVLSYMQALPAGEPFQSKCSGKPACQRHCRPCTQACRSCLLSITSATLLCVSCRAAAGGALVGAALGAVGRQPGPARGRQLGSCAAAPLAEAAAGGSLPHQHPCPGAQESLHGGVRGQGVRVENISPVVEAVCGAYSALLLQPAGLSTLLAAWQLPGPGRLSFGHMLASRGPCRLCRPCSLRQLAQPASVCGVEASACPCTAAAQCLSLQVSCAGAEQRCSTGSPQCSPIQAARRGGRRRPGIPRCPEA